MKSKKDNLTEQQKRIIKECSGLGLTQADIAHLLEVPTSTFKYWIANDEEINTLIQQGKAIAKRKVARRLMEMIEGEGKEAAAAVFFYLKCQAGWRETDKHSQESAPEVNIYLPQKEKPTADNAN